MVSYVYATIEVPGQLANSSASVGGINDFGQIVGTFIDASGRQKVFVRTGSRFDTVSDGQVTGINNLDQVAGSYGLFGGGSFTQQFHPLTRQFTDLTNLVSPFEGSSLSGGINDFGALAGTDVYLSPEGLAGGVAWVEKGGTFTKLPDLANFTEATGINDRGQVTGWLSNGSGLYIDGPDPKTVGFVDTNGTITTVSDPDGFATKPAAINNLGMVAGSYSVVTYPNNPPDYTASRGFVESGGTYTTISVPGATSTEVTGINDFGQVVGVYSTGYVGGAFVATPGDHSTAGSLPLDAHRPAMRPGSSEGMVR